MIRSIVELMGLVFLTIALVMISGVDKNKTLKEKIFLIMGRPNQHRFNRSFNTFLVSIIFINVCAVILETVPSLTAQYAFTFHCVEMFSIVVFSVEYFLRIWTSSLDERFGYGFKGKIKYIFSAFAIIDLLAIVPSLISVLFFVDLRMLRAVRLFRLIRLLKLVRYSLAIYMIIHVFKKKKPELLITFSLGLVLMTISASLMYYIEHEVQPDKFSSIPATMWWAVATLTTVGYGDVYPITTLGKMMGALIAFFGVGLFALPAALLATGFSELQGHSFDQRTSLIKEACPSCGRAQEVEETYLQSA